MGNKEHTVTFYFTWYLEDITFTSNNIFLSFVSDKNVNKDITEDAYYHIKKAYKNLFSYDNFIIHIINIS